jgi:sulfhydrogenase subunit beta (sulfur reductase)
MGDRSGFPARVLDPVTGIGALVDELIRQGYRVVAPHVHGGTIDWADATTGDTMPTGVWVDAAPGRFRLVADGSHRRFDWTPGAASPKRTVFPAEQVILRIRRRDGSFTVDATQHDERPIALVGVRDCDVRALGVLDGVLADSRFPDPGYAARRAGTLTVAVTCGHPAATCWCTSMGGSPSPGDGADLALTELDDVDGHRLLAQPRTPLGDWLLGLLPGTPASELDVAAGAAVVAAATERIAPRLDGATLAAALAGSELADHWERVAARCLSCGSCTLVCPTCFCSTIDDHTSLATDGDEVAERRRRWASCFELDHSNLVGRPVRATTAARYRQWLTHKLVTWPAQFGSAGCVGCGRCSAWCPAGIDLPEEASTLAASPTLTASTSGDRSITRSAP